MKAILLRAVDECVRKVNQLTFSCASESKIYQPWLSSLPSDTSMQILSLGSRKFLLFRFQKHSQGSFETQPPSRVQCAIFRSVVNTTVSESTKISALSPWHFFPTETPTNNFWRHEDAGLAGWLAEGEALCPTSVNCRGIVACGVAPQMLSSSLQCDILSIRFGLVRKHQKFVNKNIHTAESGELPCARKVVSGS
jgi:hypothetical protein